jgi:hypothetical protein
MKSLRSIQCDANPALRALSIGAVDRGERARLASAAQNRFLGFSVGAPGRLEKPLTGRHAVSLDHAFRRRGMASRATGGISSRITERRGLALGNKESRAKSEAERAVDFGTSVGFRQGWAELMRLECNSEGLRGPFIRPSARQ